jgi:poly(3-hydroxybutyrate) depolymerase
MKLVSTIAIVPLIPLAALLLAASRSQAQDLPTATSASSTQTVCSADGAPPIRTDEPVSIPLYCKDGKLLSFKQNGIVRHACFNPPRQAQGKADGRKWPLVIYLHGSLTTPESLYLVGRNLFDLHDTYPLSGRADVPGFYILSPEGRRATPWPANGGNGPITGTGFHWDEWYRNPAANLDAREIDHFLAEAIATGQIDTRRIYVFGWSNGAYTSALYGVWRSDRIAAIGQYTGADPFSRTPCPVPFEAARKVPLVLLRNLCDQLVPCTTTQAWIDTLTAKSWPFEFHNLSFDGSLTSETECAASCSKDRGIFEHIRWPQPDALRAMLRFLAEHPLP